MTKDAFDFFRQVPGSEIWPSSNPRDSPFDTFTCKLCGLEIELQMCGNFLLGEPSFLERAERILLHHLTNFHSVSIFS